MTRNVAAGDCHGASPVSLRGRRRNTVVRAPSKSARLLRILLHLSSVTGLEAEQQTSALELRPTALADALETHGREAERVTVAVD